ncbi:MAG TPA: hypothetical protein VF656_09615 [Pyrinomonadaceae bacterium]|jgi:hypothetical protein
MSPLDPARRDNGHQQETRPASGHALVVAGEPEEATRDAAQLTSDKLTTALQPTGAGQAALASPHDLLADFFGKRGDANDSAHGSESPRAATDAGQQPPLKGFPLDVSTRESGWQKFGYLGNVFSLVLAGVVAFYGYQISKAQVALQTQQNAILSQQAITAEAQRQATIADMRAKFLENLVDDKNETKQMMASIGLAAYKEDALPLVQLALGVEQSSVRQAAVGTVFLLFQSESVPRQKLVETLMTSFASRNPYMQLGVLECFVKIDRRLDPLAGQQVVDCVVGDIDPQASCNNAEQRRVMLEAAKFLGLGYDGSAERLLKIVGQPKCADAWSQALVNLPKVAEEFSPSERIALAGRLRELKTTVLGDLENRSDLEYLKMNDVAFEDFRADVEEQFNDIINWTENYQDSKR